MTGLYIHIPFCMQKCKYCDFVSFAGGRGKADEYIEALKREALEYRGTQVDTIFIGGGTPSILSAEQISEICMLCFDMFRVDKNYEFTIEANPGTLDDDKITAMLDGGINRISVGVQSFNDDELKSIGRIHYAQTAYNTICHLKKMGFSNINLDLMTALPNQNMKSLRNTLETAVSLPVKHISAYSLIIEEGTPLEKEYSAGRLKLSSDDEDREMYRYTVDFMSKNNFLQYEISNFAKDGFECRHNIKYWTGDSYIGIGIAAHSYMDGKRFYNTSDMEEYINGAEKDVILLTREDKISEFMITGLRMNDGVSEKDFYERFGVSMAEIFSDKLSKFVRLGLMKYDSGNYALTPRGIDISNSILCEFV